MLSSKFTSPPSEISATPLDTRFKLLFILCLAEFIRHLPLNLVWVSRISVLRSSWWFDWGILLIRKRRWMLSWDLLSSWAFPMHLISPAILRRNAIALFWLCFSTLCQRGFSRASCLILTQPFFFLVRATCIAHLAFRIGYIAWYSLWDPPVWRWVISRREIIGKVGCWWNNGIGWPAEPLSNKGTPPLLTYCSSFCFCYRNLREHFEGR